MGNDMYYENDEPDPAKKIRRRKKQLYAAIRERMEFYFSDSNLQKERFLSQLISDNPEVDLTVFLKFNKIMQLTNNTRDLVKALKKSEFLKLNEDKTKVFRTTPIRTKTNVDACTIYVEQLSCDTDHDWLKDVFSKFGKVDYVSIPKYRSSGKIKGFAFVEFDSPEAADNALKEFEKAGCCLTNQMNPEQLCSIATHEDDNTENKNEGNHTSNETKISKNDITVLDMELKKGHKRKSDYKEKLNDDNSVSAEKKIKLETVDLLDSNEAEKSGLEMTSDDDKKAGKNDDRGIKKKKNRKKKKSHKTKYVRDIQSYGLQILSKDDWKTLRNKYLNIQKEKMKKLKQHLYRSQMNHIQRQQQLMEVEAKPRFQFKPGVVVKVTFDEPLIDANQINQFKSDAKTLGNVVYVDVTQGSPECYIRFSDNSVVQEIMQTKPWDTMLVLEGDEEQEYWEKMKRDRTEKFVNKKKLNHKRGRIKLINKAEKLISKRIRLSVDE